MVALNGDDQSPIDDETLIAAVQSGNERVAAQLYQHLLRTVDHTLYRIFGCREHDHDDLVQATFEQIVATLSSRRFAGACSLKTWASTLAAHVGLKALRSRRRERKVLDRYRIVDETTSVAASNPEHEADARQDLERLRSMLACINPRRAEVVFLRDVLGHDLAEISVMMGLSVAATQSLLSRGRRDLVAGLQATPRSRPGEHR